MSVNHHRSARRVGLLIGLGCGLLSAIPAIAQPAASSAVIADAAINFDIPAQSLEEALIEFGRQSRQELFYNGEDVAGKASGGVSGSLSRTVAMAALLEGTGLEFEQTASGGMMVGDRATLDAQRSARNAPAQGASAIPSGTAALVTAGTGAAATGLAAGGSGARTVIDVARQGGIEEIIVTAQKREERLMDVPIAISAFSSDDLNDRQIDGGSELLRAIPNVTFSKSNFSMYNFAIRGIGTKAISAASDPAVAISFNNSPMIRNRLFEQEYLDVNRVEILRGPQGTLYGRNATAGVVNMIPNLPSPDFEAMLKAEAGNYGSMRGQMMVNVPLGDTFSLRGAASLTTRDGFDRNTFLDTDINDRDLYSTRLSAAWQPSERFSASLIWEHFEEDDNRLRTGKQLCTRDPGPTQVRTASITNVAVQGKLSQGCLPGSLYDAAAYQAPNASGMAQLQIVSQGLSLGYRESTGVIKTPVYIIDPGLDPYAGVQQSRNLREISTSYEPIYRAKNDVLQLNLSYQLTDDLNLVSQTLYTKDEFYASQDYARYMSNPIFNDSNGLYSIFGDSITGSEISPGGVYTDPQLGPSNRMLSVDLSQSDNDQIYQEFRLQSSYDGRVNYSIGANYLKFDTEDNYYVFNNTFSMMAEYFYGSDSSKFPAVVSLRCQDASQIECVYVDYSSLKNLAGDGHNYFRSRNVVQTESAALFGEVYVNLSEAVRLTLGGRYTNDRKTTTPYPSQLLLGYSDISGGVNTGGSVVRGLVAQPDVRQNWDAVTGRAIIDWKLNDDAMFYLSLARGYKGGGVNPPRADINPSIVQYQPLPETFDPESVNALELGSKVNLLDGRLRLSATGFYYDYKDYQVSQIVDRISLNENFDAESMGLELEAAWSPTRELRIDANVGYLKTRIGKGEESIDVMNRTQGNDDWVVVRPWAQVPSNCIAPASHVETVMNSPLGQNMWLYALSALCGGAARVGSYDPDFPANLPMYQFFGINYNPLRDAPNAGRGFSADLSGNELPNAPRFTGNLGMQYTFHLRDWDLTLRGDYYRQSSSYFRVYNTEYDRLKGWDNVNAAMTLNHMAMGLTIQAFVKNLFNDSPIVDAFTNSDDSMLTTNVFTLDPRLFGVSVRKTF